VSVSGFLAAGIYRTPNRWSSEGKPGPGDAAPAGSRWLPASGRDRDRDGGGVVPAVDAAVVVRDLAVGEEPGDRDLAEHATDGVDLLLELVLEDHPAADAVEQEHAGG